MAALDIMKEYLVSLGFEVDKPTFDKSQRAIKTMDKAVSDFSGSVTKSFVKTGSSALKNFAIAEAAVSSFFVAANVGIAKYISGLAEADIKNEMFARKMWMNKENAIAYKNSLSALGADIQDLYLSPELLEKFNQLRQQSFEMGPPEEFAAQMKNVRAITFEFQRMKLEAAYAMQWIGYYLYKYLEKPITEVKKRLKDFNDKLTLNMPHWTKQVAEFVSWFVRLGEAGVWGIQKIWEAFDQLSLKTKVAGGAILVFLGLLKSGPIGWLIAGITALLLLLDDYKTYQEGGKSLFGKQWEELDKLKKSLEDDGTLAGFKESLDSISDSLGNIFEDMGKIADNMAQKLGFEDFNDFFNSNLHDTLRRLGDELAIIAGYVEIINGITALDTEKIKSGLAKINIHMHDFFFGEYKNKENEEGFSSGTPTKENEKSSSNDISKKDKKESSSNGTPKSGISGIDILQGIINPTVIGLHADGGIQTTPHFGWVAEKYPESIIPLDPSKRQNALGLLAQTAGLMGVPMSSTSVQNITNVNFNNTPQYKIYGSEPTATAKAIDRIQPDYGIMLRNFKGAY